jgi:broad specificity phosphatase PhoE
MAATPNSPITGIIDEEMVIIDFGKYEGKSVKDIAEVDVGTGLSSGGLNSG